MWTNIYLEGIENGGCSHRHRHRHRNHDVYESLSKNLHKNHTVVFGRNTHHTTFPVCKRSKPLEEHGNKSRGDRPYNSPHDSNEPQRNLNDDSKTTTLPVSSSSSLIIRQDTKMRGRQIMDCKHDRTIAKEKRKRQMKYSLEVQKSRENAVSLQISSITRIVVQSFRKLIDCERCALFLMDHATNELCFKPGK